MIVVHPFDPSTRMLSKIYEGLDGVTLFDSWTQRREILGAIAAATREETILLLGHGCPCTAARGGCWTCATAS